MKPISVYVHIPFCTIKCGYCDFNAYAGMGTLQESYFDALLREIDASRPVLSARAIATVAFGGGTPGESPPLLIGRVIAALRDAAPVAPGAEVSLEANPGTTTGRMLQELRDAGVTRVSFGAQSFDAQELAFLDRIHSPEAISASVRLAREAGFDDVGLDLIYAIPGQSMASWERSLEAAMALRTDHLSTYALTVEVGTPLALRVDRGEVDPVDSDVAADMYERATDLLEAAGFSQYELSNWARTGHESRHNCVYWTGGDYLGLGAGAHGYLDGDRYENIAHPRDYIAAVRTGTRPIANAYTPDRATAMFDWLTLRLRLVGGFAAAEFEARFGVSLEAAVGPVLTRARDASVLSIEEEHVRLTRHGRLLHVELA
ncbi:MAG: radical SAM family heme chaperone HemW, partial [Dehalococcoidia bacterium]